MPPPRARPQQRVVRRTLLVVGEGLAEEVFLRHLKALYVERGHKTVTIKNAKGKGGGHVLTYTAGQSKAAEYDQVAALLDTDADWNDQRRAQANRQRILVFEFTPCLEALLLAIAGHRAPADTLSCKRAFRQHFGHEAHTEALYPVHWPRQVLDAAAVRIDLLQRLIGLLIA